MNCRACNGGARATGLCDGLDWSRELQEQALISIVDDDESVREGMVSLMKSHGYKVESFASAESFLKSPHRHRTCCLIADMHMPGRTGLELITTLAADRRPIPSILITARHEESLRSRARRAGAVCYLTKPFKEEELLACIQSALKSFDPGTNDHDI